MADFVAEVGEWAGMSAGGSRDDVRCCRALPRERRLRHAGTNARDAHATQAIACGGGLATNLASRRRF